jgi:hypothetical protein
MVVGPSSNSFHPFPTVLENMAPRKRSRQDSAASSSAPAVPTSRIDETHAAQLARHLAGLRKLRRFTDLKV